MRYAALPGYCFIINCKLVYIELRGPVIGFRLMRKLIMATPLGANEIFVFPTKKKKRFPLAYLTGFIRCDDRTHLYVWIIYYATLKALSVARSRGYEEQREGEEERGGRGTRWASIWFWLISNESECGEISL